MTEMGHHGQPDEDDEEQQSERYQRRKETEHGHPHRIAGR